MENRELFHLRGIRGIIYEVLHFTEVLLGIKKTPSAPFLNKLQAEFP